MRDHPKTSTVARSRSAIVTAPPMAAGSGWRARQTRGCSPAPRARSPARSTSRRTSAGAPWCSGCSATSYFTSSHCLPLKTRVSGQRIHADQEVIRLARVRELAPLEAAVAVVQRPLRHQHRVVHRLRAARAAPAAPAGIPRRRSRRHNPARTRILDHHTPGPPASGSPKAITVSADFPPPSHLPTFPPSHLPTFPPSVLGAPQATLCRRS